MPIVVKCGEPNCGKTFRVKDELAGKAVKCPRCQKPVRIPTASARGEARAAPAAPVPAGNRAAPAPPKGARSSNTRSQPADAPPVLSLPRLVLRPKRGLRNLFNTDLEILNPETKDRVGVAGDRTRKLFGLFKVNPNTERWEILDADQETPLFAIRITKNREFTSGDLKGIECDLLDADDEDKVLACLRYKLKGVVMKGWQLSLLDEQEEEIGRVSLASGKVMAGNAPRITLSSPNGRELGTITHKGIADVMAMMKQKKAEGKKFGMVSSLGEPGLEVGVAEKSVGDLAVHRALLALAVLVEVTKIGKEQVSLSRH